MRSEPSVDTSQAIRVGGSPIVSLMKVPEYDSSALDSAFAESAEIAGFPDIRGALVLVKPNLLNASAPDKAVTTNPAFTAAAIRFLKARGAARVLVGDSPAWQGANAAARTAGLLEATVRSGAEWVEFTTGNPRSSPEAKLVKSFSFASVLDECDLVVNLPKLKTHRLMLYTGAVKNLFGLLPGLAKSGLHMRFPDKARFGTMLVDLARAVPSCFTFMDGIVAMQGDGPGNGEPVRAGLFLASSDAAALDWIAAGCIGYDPARIPYLVDAAERSGIDTRSPSIVTEPLAAAECRVPGFQTLPYDLSVASHVTKLPSFTRALIARTAIDRPKFDAATCIGCSGCVKVCPASALALGRDRAGRHRVRIDDSACISCFCCHEVCPAKSISIGKVLYRPKDQRKRA